jgi:ABC-2 type transport system ATP-binding protein
MIENAAKNFIGKYNITIVILKEHDEKFKAKDKLIEAFGDKVGIVILDEPTSGLDPNQLAEIRELIVKIGRQKTVMLSTHIMQEVEAMCDHALIIDRGNIVAENLVMSELAQSNRKLEDIFKEVTGKAHAL